MHALKRLATSGHRALFGVTIRHYWSVVRQRELHLPTVSMRRFPISRAGICETGRQDAPSVLFALFAGRVTIGPASDGS
jgi:hypothetical protein